MFLQIIQQYKNMKEIRVCKHSTKIRDRINSTKAILARIRATKLENILIP